MSDRILTDAIRAEIAKARAAGMSMAKRLGPITLSHGLTSPLLIHRHRYDLQASAVEIAEAVTWIVENTKSYEINIEDMVGFGCNILSVTFKNDEDAVKFKMRFGESG